MDLLGFLGRCLGAAVIFKGVDMAGDALVRKAQARAEALEQMKLDYVQNLEEEVKRLRAEKNN